jgi:hypothetical protein
MISSSQWSSRPFTGTNSSHEGWITGSDTRSLPAAPPKGASHPRQDGVAAGGE